MIEMRAKPWRNQLAFKLTLLSIFNKSALLVIFKNINGWIILAHRNLRAPISP